MTVIPNEFVYVINMFLGFLVDESCEEEIKLCNYRVYISVIELIRTPAPEYLIKLSRVPYMYHLFVVLINTAKTRQRMINSHCKSSNWLSGRSFLIYDIACLFTQLKLLNSHFNTYSDPH